MAAATAAVNALQGQPLQMLIARQALAQQQQLLQQQVMQPGLSPLVQQQLLQQQGLGSGVVHQLFFAFHGVWSSIHMSFRFVFFRYGSSLGSPVRPRARFWPFPRSCIHWAALIALLWTSYVSLFFSSVSSKSSSYRHRHLIGPLFFFDHRRISSSSFFSDDTFSARRAALLICQLCWQRSSKPF